MERKEIWNGGRDTGWGVGGAIQDPFALGGFSQKELKRSQIQPLLFPLRHMELVTHLPPGVVTLQFEAGILPSPLSLCLIINQV